MAQEPATFTTQFNSDVQPKYDHHWGDDSTWDIAEDAAESGRIWPTIAITIIALALIFGWHAESVYLAPPAITITIPAPQPPIFQQQQAIAPFPSGWDMRCIALNLDMKMIRPNPIPVCLQEMRRQIEAKQK